jgi:hypothetical protein
MLLRRHSRWGEAGAVRERAASSFRFLRFCHSFRDCIVALLLQHPGFNMTFTSWPWNVIWAILTRRMPQGLPERCVTFVTSGVTTRSVSTSNITLQFPWSSVVNFVVYLTTLYQLRSVFCIESNIDCAWWVGNGAEEGVRIYFKSVFLSLPGGTEENVEGLRGLNCWFLER